ncbi:WYL domain-containing protein [Azospirillum argentinense]
MRPDHDSRPTLRSPDLRWGIERRLEFIELRLFWEGRLNRSDLTRVFGISAMQASADLRRYDAMAPGNARYDRNAKCFVRSTQFAPLLVHPDSASYLHQLSALAEGVLSASESWLRQVPSYDKVSFPCRLVDAHILRAVLDAVNTRCALNLHYQSMAHPEPRWCWIAPHALGLDGAHWYARAFCHRDQRFKDFRLSRVVAVGDVRPDDTLPSSDRAWHTPVTLRIGVHPALSAGPQRVIARDYDMENGERAFTTRLALLPYLLKRLSLDVGSDVRAPQDQPIVLLNREEIASLMGGVDHG